MPAFVGVIGAAIAFWMMCREPGFAPLIGVMLIPLGLAWEALNDRRSGNSNKEE